MGEGEYSEAQVASALETARLPVRPCGLNADWSVRAWHLGPSAEPNTHSGDLYLLDDENVPPTFSIVRRYYSDSDEIRDEDVSVIADHVALEDAILIGVQKAGR